MINKLEEYLRESRSILFPQKVSPKRISFFEARSFRKTLLFVFIDKEKFPSLLIKIVDESRFIERLKREYQNLVAFQQLDSPHLTGTFPRPLFLGTINGYEVLMETVIPGRSIASLQGRNVRKYVHLASKWLLEFHCATKSKEESIDLTTELQYSIEGFQSSFELSQKQRSFLKRIIEDTQASKGTRLSSVCRHYDFVPENILISKDAAGVVDWEYACFGDLPLVDLFHFLVRCQVRESISKIKEHLSFSSTIKREVDKTTPSVDDFRKTFFMLTDFSDLAKEAICHYCSGLSIDKALAKLLLVQYIIEEGNLDWFLLMMEKENALLFA